MPPHSSIQHFNVIRVHYTRGTKKLFMGRLALQNRKIFFEYDADFLQTGLELSPFKLPLKAGLISNEDHLFDGLFGVFNDSLPDGFGRLLLDRKLSHLGINPKELTTLDRLRYVGTHGMGALSYEPEITTLAPISHHNSLDDIANECFQFQEHDENEFVDDLLAMNGSSSGARPKILVSLDKGSNKNSFQPTNSVNHAIASSCNDWIIKFRATADPKDIGAIEYAYHLMAVSAGLEVPEAKLFRSQKCAGYFGSKRFDRIGSQLLHMHTISGLLHADHRIPSLDYETIMKTTLWLTKDIRECIKQFRYAIFNVLTHNRDDHAKNFSYLMNEHGVWRVSPAYDLTFSSGPAGEHCTTIMGEGKYPKLTHFLELAAISSIKKSEALEIIDEIKHVVSKWQDFAKQANVTKQSSSMIQNTLDRILKNL